jgi:hypothetical protein
MQQGLAKTPANGTGQHLLLSRKTTETVGNPLPTTPSAMYSYSPPISGWLAVSRITLACALPLPPVLCLHTRDSNACIGDGGTQTHMRTHIRAHPLCTTLSAPEAGRAQSSISFLSPPCQSPRVQQKSPDQQSAVKQVYPYPSTRKCVPSTLFTLQQRFVPMIRIRPRVAGPIGPGTSVFSGLHRASGQPT